MRFEKIIYQLLLLLLFNIPCFASFEVSPLKIDLQLGTSFAMLRVHNHDKPQFFSLSITDGKSDAQNTKDLSFSPPSFGLGGNQTQIVRIMTKPGVNYVDKSYALFITATYGGDDVIRQSFKIPISIAGATTTSENLKQDPKKPASIKGGIMSNNNAAGLTQIKIIVPVSVIIH